MNLLELICMITGNGSHAMPVDRVNPIDGEKVYALLRMVDGVE